MRVFAQREQLTLDLPELLRATQRYFDVTLDVESRATMEGGSEQVQVRVSSAQHGYEGVLTIRSRSVRPDDLSDARLAEERGRAAGMAGLAARCKIVWEVQAVGADCALARLNLCAVLASVALGPVLPDDGETLYGVRGAMERVQKLLRSPP